jgi:CubicO group peptidase (beta-lactamase class C family)
MFTLRYSRVILVTVALASVAIRQDVDLGARAAAVRSEVDAPALGLMIQRAGAEPQVHVDGVRQAGEEDAVTTTDAWHWGSITKSMTATLVARLVEKGEVEWTDTVGERLGEAVADMRDEYRAVDFRHLLSHRGGLQANIPMARFREFGEVPEDAVLDRLAWVTIALGQEPVGPMETTFEYSNNGFIVAGAMLEAATGESWEELMQREVFAPLGIKGAGFGGPPGAAPRGHVAGREGDQAMPEDADNPPALGPAGRVHMPMADMARYLDAHARGREDFLSAESFATLHTPPFGGNYALGWVVTDPEGRWHNGSNTMWYAEVAFDRETGTVAAVAVNDGSGSEVRAGVKALLVELMKD